jgi:hypothetical protein
MLQNYGEIRKKSYTHNQKFLKNEEVSNVYGIYTNQKKRP